MASPLDSPRLIAEVRPTVLTGRNRSETFKSFRWDLFQSSCSEATFVSKTWNESLFGEVGPIVALRVVIWHICGFGAL